MTLHDYYYKSINADLRLLNNTLMSYSNYQSGDWLPRCMLKPFHRNQSLQRMAKRDWFKYKWLYHTFH
jgi:hypothetical protein